MALAEYHQIQTWLWYIYIYIYIHIYIYIYVICYLRVFWRYSVKTMFTPTTFSRGRVLDTVFRGGSASSDISRAQLVLKGYRIMIVVVSSSRSSSTTTTSTTTTTTTTTTTYYVLLWLLLSLLLVVLHLPSAGMVLQRRQLLLDRVLARPGELYYPSKAP